MPVKVRRRKHRVSEDVEAWTMLFEFGCDYLRTLDFRTTDEAREAAREAWPRLGAAFLRTRPENPTREVPWALETFGEPPCR